MIVTPSADRQMHATFHGICNFPINPKHLKTQWVGLLKNLGLCGMAQVYWHHSFIKPF